MRKKLPIGIEFFEEFKKENYFYVDKTMFIADLLNNLGKVNLFTRPRRFGKSLTMSMLKSFFETGCDPSMFQGLRISKEKELCEKYMGQFPVISITLKSVEGLQYKDAHDALRRVIGREASRFRFLSESDRLLPEERKMYQALVQMENGCFMIPDGVLIDSIRILSELLFKHYGKKIILLIDEYDVPLDKAFQAGYYDFMISLLKSLFGNALKTNEFLYFAVLTGCLRISKESIFTGLNNLKINTVTDSRYDEYFGFTQNDVRDLLDYYELSSYFNIFNAWYDGYLFGKESLYCPWDVINYCDSLLEDCEAEPENYWANTSGNALIKRFIGKADRQTRSEIEQLIAGDIIEKQINQELTYPEIDQSIDNLWSVLFCTGYLTQKGRLSGRKYYLAIPNREIHELFVSQIREWFREETRADTKKLEKFCNSFISGESDVIEELLNEYLWNTISIRDTAVKNERKESFFHGMLLGLLQYENSWEITSNSESGFGYSDISVKTPKRIGIIIEVKYASDGNLERSCQKALAQIEEKKYDAVLKRDGMKEIKKYGIAFYKKNCKVVIS